LYIVIVTGGIGSGKSTATRHLGRRGALTVSLDEMMHALLIDNAEMCRGLIDAFGEDILDESGAVIPSKLAARAFNDEESTELLDSLTHPYVSEVAFAAVNRAQSACVPFSDAPVFVIEVPLPDKASDLLKAADEIIAIIAPRDVRMARLAAKGFTLADSTNRLARQLDQDDFIALSDTVIQNDGSLAKLHETLDRWWEARAMTGWCNERR
jgi:dephospho-CoA kinase